MKCSDIERKIALSDELTPAESEHVQNCKNCSAFLRDSESFRSIQKIETPTHLKSRTMRMSLQQLESQTESKAPASYFERLWQTPRTALILTGFSILALFVTFLYQLNCDRTDTFCRVSALFLIIILAQNIITALCVPLLIQHKNNLHYKW
jgi:hypothetical protein